jgi:hypothetical protein
VYINWKRTQRAHYRNIGGRSRSHCCRRKPLSVSNTECVRACMCVCVTLVVQHSMRMRRITLPSVCSVRLWHIFLHYPVKGGTGSSVSIATGYGLDGPGIESRWRRYFPHLSRPVLGPIQPSVQGVQPFPGGRKRPGRDADPSPLLVPRSKKQNRAIPLLSLRGILAWRKSHKRRYFLFNP